MGKTTGKSTSKNLNGKYSQEHFDHGKESATDALKTTSKRVISKTAEATCDLIGSKTSDSIASLKKFTTK